MPNVLARCSTLRPITTPRQRQRSRRSPCESVHRPQERQGPLLCQEMRPDPERPSRVRVCVRDLLGHLTGRLPSLQRDSLKGSVPIWAVWTGRVRALLRHSESPAAASGELSYFVWRDGSRTGGRLLDQAACPSSSRMESRGLARSVDAACTSAARLVTRSRAARALGAGARRRIDASFTMSHRRQSGVIVSAPPGYRDHAHDPPVISRITPATSARRDRHLLAHGRLPRAGGPSTSRGLWMAPRTARGALRRPVADPPRSQGRRSIRSGEIPADTSGRFSIPAARPFRASFAWQSGLLADSVVERGIEVNRSPVYEAPLYYLLRRSLGWVHSAAASRAPALAWELRSERGASPLTTTDDQSLEGTHASPRPCAAAVPSAIWRAGESHYGLDRVGRTDPYRLAHPFSSKSRPRSVRCAIATRSSEPRSECEGVEARGRCGGRVGRLLALIGADTSLTGERGSSVRAPPSGVVPRPCGRRSPS